MPFVKLLVHGTWLLMEHFVMMASEEELAKSLWDKVSDRLGREMHLSSPGTL